MKKISSAIIIRRGGGIYTHVLSSYFSFVTFVTFIKLCIKVSRAFNETSTPQFTFPTKFTAQEREKKQIKVDFSRAKRAVREEESRAELLRAH